MNKEIIKERIGSENFEGLPPASKEKKAEKRSSQKLTDKSLNDNVLYATFLLDEQEFAIDVENVREAIEFQKNIIKIPATIDVVEGIINLRGQIIPLINLRAGLKITPITYDQNCRIAIVKCKGNYFGLLFDDIKKVTEVEKNNIQFVKDSSNKTAIEGIIHIEEDEELIQLLNPDHLIEKFDIPLIPNDLEEDNRLKRKIIRIQNITVNIGDVEYGINIDNVREIIKVPETNKRIEVKDYIKGVINIRGEILTLIDMRTLMGMEERGLDEESRVIVIVENNIIYGIIVDSLKEVILFEKDLVMPIPLLSVGRMQKAYKGVVHISNEQDERDVILLDVEQLFDEDEKQTIRNNVDLHDEKITEKYEKSSQKKSTTGRKSLDKKVFITFKVEDDLGIEILKLQEIIPYPDNIIKIPGQLDALEGLFNFRGSVVPVINLRTFFDFKPYSDITTTKILIISQDSYLIGLIIDDLIEIIIADEYSEVQSLLVKGKKQKFKDLIENVITVYTRVDDEKRNITILNVKGIFEAINFDKQIKEIPDSKPVIKSNLDIETSKDESEKNLKVTPKTKNDKSGTLSINTKKSDDKLDDSNSLAKNLEKTDDLVQAEELETSTVKSEQTDVLLLTEESEINIESFEDQIKTGKDQTFSNKVKSSGLMKKIRSSLSISS